MCQRLDCFGTDNSIVFNPLTAKLFNLNFHPLEVVSRWRDPQFQVGDIYSDLTQWRSNVFKYCWLMSHFIFYLVDLVKRYAPLDSRITVSSVYNLVHEKKKIRLEYNGAYCAWVKADYDASPWVKFDLVQSRVAVGVKIGKRCDVLDGEQYVTSFHVSSSEDGVTWSYIGTDVQAVYKGIIETWWFDMEVTARYWKIEPVTFILYSSMQADFIGYI